MSHFYWGLAASYPASTGLDSSAGTLATPVSVAPSGGAVLTVGAGEMFATLGAALAVATDGTTILVDAGTYTDDFGTVSTGVTIAGVGGMANFVADVPPPNAKGILTVDANVTIENCTFSGAAVSDANGGNGAGVRYEGGQMVLENCAFTGNQNGILAFPAIAGLTNTITIDHCLFNANGSGSGYTHNVYVGNVSKLTFTNNISEGAIVGHELKSRAYVNDIENNIFRDGPTATASYSIDLPNGGQDSVLNNIIEKGPMAQNQALIHFGGEGIPYAGSSLLVSGNQFINDRASAVGVVNQTAISVTIAGNSFTNFDPTSLAQGPAVETNNVDGNGTLLPDQTLAGVLPGNTLVITDTLAHTVTLSGTLLAVQGGGGLLTAIAANGHVIVLGGSGGLNFSELKGSGGNTITTMAGATDTIVVAGQDLIDSEGNDLLSFGAGNITALLNGNSVVSDGNGNNQLLINGTASITGHGGHEFLTVGGSGSASITGSLGFLTVQNNGGSFQFSILQNGVADIFTDTGGAVQATVNNGSISVTTASGPVGAALSLGAGPTTVTSAGADTIYAGTGAATIIVEAGANIYAGSGPLSVFARSDSVGANVYGNSGTVTIAGDTGNITYYGSINSTTVQDKLSNITLLGGDGRLTVNGGSGNILNGGAGGLVYNATDGGGADTITTQAGAYDILKLGGPDVVNSYGFDTIRGGSGNQTIALYGNSTLIGSTGNSQISLYGTDTVNGVGSDQIAVARGAVASINAGSLTGVSETMASVKFVLRNIYSASVAGGQATILGGSSTTLSITTMANMATGVTLSTGAASLTTNGQDTVHAGSGADSITIDGGTATITGSIGILNVFNADLSASDTQTVIGGRGAINVAQETGSLNFIGGAGSAVIDGGAGQLFVTGGAGASNVMGGQLGETLIAGAGSLTAALSAGGAAVEFGAGRSLIQEAGYGGANLFEFVAGHGGGADTIEGFRFGTDSLALNGVTVKSETVSTALNQTMLVLSDNTHVYLHGFADTQLALSHS